LLALIDAPDLDQEVEPARQQLNQAEAQLTQQQATPSTGEAQGGPIFV
jgi:multidrug resistance efflux pump